MAAKRYPVMVKTLVDFETGGSKIVDEMKEERAARLRRGSNCRRREIDAKFRSVMKDTLLEALAKASRLAYAGKPYPIHFDIYFEAPNGARKATSTRRYTVLNAAMHHHLFYDGKYAAPKKGIAFVQRHPDIPPDFVHKMIWTT